MNNSFWFHFHGELNREFLLTIILKWPLFVCNLHNAVLLQIWCIFSEYSSLDSFIDLFSWTMYNLWWFERIFHTATNEWEKSVHSIYSPIFIYTYTFWCEIFLFLCTRKKHSIIIMASVLLMGKQPHKITLYCFQLFIYAYNNTCYKFISLPLFLAHL